MNTNVEIKTLCLELANADTEFEVIKILEKYGYWQDENSWKYYGDNENNFSTIGNQQSTAEAALVEKIINSVDAVLTNECLVKGIKPDSPEAPQTLQEALHDFFGIYNGKLANVDPRTRTKLAENILIVSSGEKSNPSYSIIDKGEGQSPMKMPHTFLSLNKSNKLRIPFVQGKYNMGATGSLQFCGKHNLQLIISKRNPEIKINETSDATLDYWGFTVIRREDPTLGIRSSAFKYLAPNGEILKFKSDSLPLLPKEYPFPLGNPLDRGSFIKMYEYQLKGGLKTVITLDLYYKLSLLMPSIALPVSLYERRVGYRAHSYQTTMSGLSVRLEEDKGENLESGFPSSSEVQVSGEKMKVLVHVFKKDQSEKYAPSEGIIFVVNGQSQGFMPRSFFERRSVGMSYLKDSILAIVDCTELSGRTREDLFMTSRDRLRDGPIKEQIEEQIEDLIKNHPGLRELRERRRREEIESVLSESKPLASVLNKIIKDSPSLSKLLLSGINIQNPFNLISVTTKPVEFKGKRYPSFFKLKKEYPKDRPKQCNINLRFRVQFETDAENEYFERDNNPGDFLLTINEKVVDDFVLNLWNGLATLTITLPSGSRIGDSLVFKTETSDNSKVDPFTSEFYIKVIEQVVIRPGPGGERPNPPDDTNGEDREIPSMLSLPNMIESRRSDGDKYEFKKDDKGSLIVKSVGDEGYDFFINMDNVYLRTEQKALHNTDHKLLEARFKYGMVLVGLMTLNAFENNKMIEEQEEDGSIFDRIYFFTKAISPVLLPMISSLGDLEL